MIISQGLSLAVNINLSKNFLFQEIGEKIRRDLYIPLYITKYTDYAFF